MSQATVDAESSARAIAAIRRTRNGEALADVDIARLVGDFLAGRVPDYQMAAWLATVTAVGLSLAETVALTRAYVDSGRKLTLGGGARPVLDKHSTGGVGDKVSLVVVPLVAACGVPVGKMSGRGLGWAGGTIDKLESVSGLRLDLGAADVKRLLKQAGMVITGQSAELTPGDAATYALRDVTDTVESVPLIAASIVAKKVAVGADGLLLDVKTGAGALLPDRAQAAALASTMVQVAMAFGLPCQAVLTDMSQPLGQAVGNALEVEEALTALRGIDVPGLTGLCRELAQRMLQIAEPGLDTTAAEARVDAAWRGGFGHEQFLRWARAQGAQPGLLDRPGSLPSTRHRTAVVADRSGRVQEIDPRAVGRAALRMGAGRLVHGARIDPAVGVVVHRRVGDTVAHGEALAEVHHHGDDAAAAAVTALRAAFRLSDEVPITPPLVYEVFTTAEGSGNDRHLSTTGTHQEGSA